jgi:hypothetical protein
LLPVLSKPMSERIVCTPTSWFLLRAVVMLLMFGVFSAMFYRDGSTGYREENLAYYLQAAFKKAREDFQAKKDPSPSEWRTHAGKQTVPFPEDTSVLPAGTQIPMPWPAVLHDAERMKASLAEQESKLFEDYRGEQKIKREAPEKPFDARKIAEQWVVFWICLALFIATLFVLLRTIRRNISVDDEALYPADGGRIPFGDLVRIDLRKWDTKGLAFLWAKRESGERKVRIDGLTYGGFKKEHGEPAESLMRRVRENFRGEIIEFVSEDVEVARPASPKS